MEIGAAFLNDDWAMIAWSYIGFLSDGLNVTRKDALLRLPLKVMQHSPCPNIMNLIQEYCSHSSSSKEENVDLPLWATEELNAQKVRKVYLITYHQVSEDRFPTRMSFLEVVLQSFASTLRSRTACFCGSSLSRGYKVGQKSKVDFKQKISFEELWYFGTFLRNTQQLL